MLHRIYVEFGQLKQLGGDCNSISSKIDGIKTDFQNTVSKLDWEIASKQNINKNANQLIQKLNDYEQALKKYQVFIDMAYEEYVKLDNIKFGDSSDPETGIPGSQQMPAMFFPDVTESDWFYKDVAYVSGKGYMIGHENGEFDPHGKLTSEHMHIVFNRITGESLTIGSNAEMTRGDAILAVYQNLYGGQGDMNAATDWATKNGIMHGDEHGNLNLDNSMTRAEFAAVLHRYESKESSLIP